MGTSTDLSFGIGCNHLTGFEVQKMAMAGLDTAGLAPIESIATGDKLEALCKGGIPRYWNDEGAVLVHPRELIQWAFQINTWTKNGTAELLAEAEAWARGMCPFVTKAG